MSSLDDAVAEGCCVRELTRSQTSRGNYSCEEDGKFQLLAAKRMRLWYSCC